MNRAERRKEKAEVRSTPAVLSCTDCGASDFVYHTPTLGTETPIGCGECGKVFGTYGVILGSIGYSRKPGATLEGRNAVVFEPRFKAPIS